MQFGHDAESCPTEINDSQNNYGYEIMIMAMILYRGQTKNFRAQGKVPMVRQN